MSTPIARMLCQAVPAAFVSALISPRPRTFRCLSLVFLDRRFPDLRKTLWACSSCCWFCALLHSAATQLPPFTSRLPFHPQAKRRTARVRLLQPSALQCPQRHWFWRVRGAALLLVFGWKPGQGFGEARYRLGCDPQRLSACHFGGRRKRLVPFPPPTPMSSV